MSNSINFGTSGHRGIIGNDFTHEHVTAIGYAIADFLKETSSTPKLIIGYDPRSGNDPQLTEGSFTHTLIHTLKNAGVSIDFCTEFTPTPAISFAIPHFHLSGGIMLTASHNPPQYNGLKFNTPNGAPAPVSVTKYIEEKGNFYLSNPPILLKNTPGTLRYITLQTIFAEHLHNTLSILLGASLNAETSSLAIDVKHGACHTTWKAIQSRCNIKNLHMLHENPDSNFGNISPNPTEKELQSLKKTLLNTQSKLGIGNDPDGDRHAILDENGDWVSPEQVTIIIAEYLKQTGKPIDGIATTLASSGLVKTWCKANNIDFYETAVGFKYFTPYLEAAKKEHKRVLAVESSGGFSCSDHTLEKCGFLPGVLLLGISLQTQKSISQLKDTLITKYGTFKFFEDHLIIDPNKKNLILDTLKNPNLETFEKHFKPIESCLTVDGLKLTFKDNDWLLIRPSGTEPLIRIYAETNLAEAGPNLIQTCKAIINEI